MITVKRKTQESALPWIFVYGGDTKYPYAFDETGKIRYYLSNRPKAYGMFPLSEGKFLFLTNKIYTPGFANPHSVIAYEMDFLGRTHREYYISDSIHHDGCEMEVGGNLLLASSSMNGAVEDAVIELNRRTGDVVRKYASKRFYMIIHISIHMTGHTSIRFRGLLRIVPYYFVCEIFILS